MKNPEDWPKALSLLHFCDISLYLTIAVVVVYVYAGDYVAFSVLSSTTGIVKKVA